jgi:hypothetical protein
MTGFLLPRKMTHITTPSASWRGPRLIDDKTVAKMGRPVVMARSDAGRGPFGFSA